MSCFQLKRGNTIMMVNKVKSNFYILWYINLVKRSLCKLFYCFLSLCPSAAGLALLLRCQCALR